MISPALTLIYEFIQFHTLPQNLPVYGPYFSNFWSILVDFGRFWSIFGQLDPSSDPILRVSSLFHFSNAGRGASGTLVVLNTVRAIQVRQAHDASWSLGLLRQAATPEVVLFDFRPLFWPNLLRFSPVQPNLPRRLEVGSDDILRPAYTTSPITCHLPLIHKIMIYKPTTPLVHLPDTSNWSQTAPL